MGIRDDANFSDHRLFIRSGISIESLSFSPAITYYDDSIAHTLPL
jgi:hypothetical protein